MKKLGYRQRRILELFEGRDELPLGFLVRGTGADVRTVQTALNGLQARGVVRRVRRGVYAADVRGAA